MPPNRSRSASPARRSASPPSRKRSRTPPRKPRGSGGFRWKNNRSAAPDDEQPRRDFQDSYRPKRYDRDAGRQRDGRAAESRNFPDRNPDRGPRQAVTTGRDGGGPRGGDRPDERSVDRADRRPREAGRQEGASKPKSQRSAPNPATTAPATFIIVTVNDRLGTKASIPCLPSDTVGEFFGRS
jgi:hypothetical protein